MQLSGYTCKLLGDGEVNPEEARRLIESFVKNNADAEISGSAPVESM